MITQVHVHPKVGKKLEQMKKQEKAPSIAAKRVETIIQALVKGARPTCAGRLTQIKDGRIKYLYKFDLGKGYRLACIKEKYNIYVLFVGSHDHCDTWLDKHSKKNPHKTELSMNIYDVDVSAMTPSKDLTIRDEIEYDSLLKLEITQEDLRKVFSGLVGNR